MCQAMGVEMAEIERRLAEMGIELPPAPAEPPGFRFSFEWVRLAGDRAHLSGHGALTPAGAPAGPFGPVPSVVSQEDATASARGAAIAMLGALQRALDDLDRITGWHMVFGAVNADPGFPETTNVANGFSDLLLEVFGREVGHHARMAVGATGLPLGFCFVAGAEVGIRP